MGSQSDLYYIGWLKYWLVTFGLLLLLAAFVLFVATPLVKNSEQVSTIETYRYQADQAATPSQFASALRQLDKALDNAGMVSGNTALLIYGLHDDMAFKRERLLSLAQRAEALAVLPTSATEVNTGLADLRVTLKKIDLGVYGFWMLQQGGIWPQIYIPAIIFGMAIAAFWVSDLLPYNIRRRVRVKATPA